RRRIPRDRRHRQKRERFRRQPHVPCPLPRKQHERAHTSHRDLHSKRQQHRHPRLPLVAHLPELQLPRKTQRRPVRNRQLPHRNKNDRRQRSHKPRRRRQPHPPCEYHGRRRQLQEKHRHQQQVFPHQNVAEPHRRHVIRLDSPALIRERVVRRRQQDQDQVRHHPREKHLWRNVAPGHLRTP